MSATCPHCGKPVPPAVLGGLCPDCMLQAGLATRTQPLGAGPGGVRDVPPAPKPDEIAPLFPQLEILEYLGRGGMGAVYKARQPGLDRFAALKILACGPEADERFAERFMREARALARLNHPNIVAVHDFGRVNRPGTPLWYLLMEFVDGVSLRQLLQEGKLKPEEALGIVPRICEALQFAHEHGIVHRDVKPENILLDREGRVKIADFGIAKILGHEAGRSNLTGEQQVVGTPHYMAPEQIEQPQRVDHRADIYSLGVVFYEMLTGELPLGKFQPPSRKVEVDVRLDDVVLRALEKEPERRYQHAREVKTEIETIASRASAVRPDVGSVPKNPPRPAKGWVIGVRWTARIASLLLFLFFGVFIFAEGLPPIASQPAGVQLNFLALALMLAGFVTGWRREGLGALLIATGWTVWHISENAMRWNLFQTPLPVAALYGLCWWETRGRRSGLAAMNIAALAIALGLGRLFCPANVFIQGQVFDDSNSLPIADAELRFAITATHSSEPARPNARADRDGRFRLYVRWYTTSREVIVSAPGYATLTTHLGPRPLGQRRLTRDFRLPPLTTASSSAGPFVLGPVMDASLKSPEGGTAELFDLDTGRLATNTQFGVNDRETHVWIRDNRLDVLGVWESDQIAVLCMDMAVIPVNSQRWWQFSAAEILADKMLAQAEPNKITGISFVTDKTDTWIFRTRENGHGILQIVGGTGSEDTRSERTVRIVYRLVQRPSGAIADPPRPKPINP